LFRGHYRHTIDTKGRLSIPSRFRDVLASGWGDKLVIVPNGKGLDVHPLQWWEELEGKVDALPQLDPDARLFRYKYLSRARTWSSIRRGAFRCRRTIARAPGS
jgi:MraZ protein